MLILLRSDSSQADLDRVIHRLSELGYRPLPIRGHQRSAVAVLGNDGRVDPSRLLALPGVEEVIHLSKPYRMVAREWRPEPTVVRLPGGLSVGGEELLVLGGPRSGESGEQIRPTAPAGRPAGAARPPAGPLKP